MTDSELNKAVARKLGRTSCGCFVFHLPMAECDSKPHVPDYCHSIQAAWEIVENFPGLALNQLPDQRWCAALPKSDLMIADTAPKAIYEAFLKGL